MVQICLISYLFLCHKTTGAWQSLVEKCRVSIKHQSDTKNKHEMGQICLISYLFLYHKQESVSHWLKKNAECPSVIGQAQK